MKRTLSTLGIAGVCLTIGFTALSGGVSFGQREPQDPGERAIMRGERFARANCSGCHNVSLDDGAPYDAPAFRRLAENFESRQLLNRFATISEHGEGAMPPIAIPNQDIDDLVAYFDHLRSWPN